MLVACLRLKNGALVGKACVPDTVWSLIWGTWDFHRTPWGGEDTEGEFVIFDQATMPSVTVDTSGTVTLSDSYCIASLDPMKPLIHIAV